MAQNQFDLIIESFTKQDITNKTLNQLVDLSIRNTAVKEQLLEYYKIVQKRIDNKIIELNNFNKV